MKFYAILAKYTIYLTYAVSCYVSGTGFAHSAQEAIIRSEIIKPDTEKQDLSYINSKADQKNGYNISKTPAQIDKTLEIKNTSIPRIRSDSNHQKQRKKSIIHKNSTSIQEQNRQQQIRYKEAQIINRPVYDYRNVILPPSISKKQYSENNEHLPKAFYSSEYSSLLFVAVESDNIQYIKALLAKNADINAVDISNNCTPLMYAFNQNKLNVFRYLLLRGADINHIRSDGKTLLHLAIMNSRYDFLDIILNESNINPSIRDKDGNLASRYMNPQILEDDYIIKSFVKKYLNVDQALLDFSDAGSYKGVQYSLESGANVNARSRDFPFDTPLLYATKRNNLKIVNLLLLHGADPNICNEYQEDALNISQNINDEIYKIVKTVSLKKSIKNAVIDEDHLYKKKY